MITSRFISIIAMLLAALAASAAMVSGGSNQTRDPLGALKRAITQANAPALTTQQETDLNALITSYRSTQPTEPDEALEAARDAFNAAILAGNLSAAQAQATVIATRSAQLS